MGHVTVQLARGARAVGAGVLLPPIIAAVVDARRREAAVCERVGTGQVTGRGQVTGSGHGAGSGHGVRSRDWRVIGQVIGQVMG